ncbi:MAG TPA: MoaD/ThiS family protein [Jiangellaceae bacterium]
MAELNVRYFASARAAAGVGSETIDVVDGMTVADVLHVLTERHPGRLAAIANASSLLLDGVVVRSPETRVATASDLDILPPFAGG